MMSIHPNINPSGSEPSDSAQPIEQSLNLGQLISRAVAELNLAALELARSGPWAKLRGVAIQAAEDLSRRGNAFQQYERALREHGTITRDRKSLGEQGSALLSLRDSQRGESSKNNSAQVLISDVYLWAQRLNFAVQTTLDQEGQLFQHEYMKAQGASADFAAGSADGFELILLDDSVLLEGADLSEEISTGSSSPDFDELLRRFMVEKRGAENCLRSLQLAEQVLSPVVAQEGSMAKVIPFPQKGSTRHQSEN